MYFNYTLMIWENNYNDNNNQFHISIKRQLFEKCDQGVQVINLKLSL